MRPAHLAGVALALGLSAAVQAAEPPPAPGEGVLMVERGKGIAYQGGTLYLVEGEVQGGKGQTVEIGGFSVMQPAVAMVQTRPATAGVTVALGKPVANPKTTRQVSTNASGQVNEAFRLQGEVRIRVGGAPGAAPAGVRYQLAVWVGPEIKPLLSPPFKASTTQALQAGGRP
jgi:hypothetical protein